MAESHDEAWEAYLEPGGDGRTLRNNLGIKDAFSMALEERWHTARVYLDLARQPPPERFDLEHLRSSHHALFGELYPWAGEIRRVNMHKTNDPEHPFVGKDLIERRFGALSTQLAREGELRGLTDDRRWADRAGYYWAHLNNIHPFREGNGRSTRLFVQQLAKASGKQVDWDSVKERLPLGAIDDASRAGSAGDYEPMRRVLQFAVGGHLERDLSPVPELNAVDAKLTRELDLATMHRTRRVPHHREITELRGTLPRELDGLARAYTDRERPVATRPVKGTPTVPGHGEGAPHGSRSGRRARDDRPQRRDGGRTR